MELWQILTVVGIFVLILIVSFIFIILLVWVTRRAYKQRQKDMIIRVLERRIINIEKELIDAIVSKKDILGRLKNHEEKLKEAELDEKVDEI